MDRVLAGLSDFALPYLDDIAVFSGIWGEHLDHLRRVLIRLREAGLTVRTEKCQLGKAEVHYLGHVIGHGLWCPSEVKIAAVVEFRRSTTKRDIWAFLGRAGYYQHYIHNVSEMASPLTDALCKNEPQNPGCYSVYLCWNAN